MLFKKDRRLEKPSKDNASATTPTAPSGEKQVCVLNISEHRYEVLVNKFITWNDGVYHFDGTPLKDKDPRIISIDYVLQGRYKDNPLSVPGTRFYSKNAQTKEAKHQENTASDESRCCIQ